MSLELPLQEERKQIFSLCTKGRKIWWTKTKQNKTQAWSPVEPDLEEEPAGVTMVKQGMLARWTGPSTPMNMFVLGKPNVVRQSYKTGRYTFRVLTFYARSPGTTLLNKANRWHFLAYWPDTFLLSPLLVFSFPSSSPKPFKVCIPNTPILCMRKLSQRQAKHFPQSNKWDFHPRCSDCKIPNLNHFFVLPENSSLVAKAGWDASPMCSFTSWVPLLVGLAWFCLSIQQI